VASNSGHERDHERFSVSRCAANGSASLASVMASNPAEVYDIVANTMGEDYSGPFMDGPRKVGTFLASVTDG